MIFKCNLIIFLFVSYSLVVTINLSRFTNECVDIHGAVHSGTSLYQIEQKLFLSKLSLSRFSESCWEKFIVFYVKIVIFAHLSRVISSKVAKSGNQKYKKLIAMFVAYKVNIAIVGAFVGPKTVEQFF